MRDCIFSPLTEMTLVFNLFVSALRKFAGYETVINLTRSLFAVDRTWTLVWFESFSALTEAGMNS